MRVLIDTNITLDFLLQREPFYQDAEMLFQAIAQKLDAIATRDAKGFTSSPISVLSVQELLFQIEQ